MVGMSSHLPQTVMSAVLVCRSCPGPSVFLRAALSPLSSGSVCTRRLVGACVVLTGVPERRGEARRPAWGPARRGGALDGRHYQKVYIALASRNWLNLVFTVQLQMCMLCII